MTFTFSSHFNLSSVKITSQIRYDIFKVHNYVLFFICYSKIHQIILINFFLFTKDVEKIITRHSYLTQILTTFYGKNLFQINVYRQRRSALSDKIHMN